VWTVIELKRDEPVKRLKTAVRASDSAKTETGQVVEIAAAS